LWSVSEETKFEEEGGLCSFSVENANKIGFPPYKGSKILPCQRCGSPMYVGPAQQEKRDEGMLSVCELCVIEVHGVDVLKNLTPLTDKGFGE